MTRTALAAATLGLVIAGVVVARGLESATPHPIPPVQTPTQTEAPGEAPSEAPSEAPTETSERPRSPKSMTPQEVVNAPDAELRTIGVAPGDPEVRISLWTALCHWCPDRPDGRGGFLGPPTFTGIALTTDGYETASYMRFPSVQVVEEALGVRDDVFLLTAYGREWLLDVDEGMVRRVARVDDELRPTDPRLWFEDCGYSPRGDSSSWCSLDLDTARAHAWPEAWSESAAPPYAGEEPWGYEPPGFTLTSTGTVEDSGEAFEAWWDTRGSRQRRPFTAADQMGTISGSPPGELTYWTRRRGSGTVDLHTGHHRGADWEVETRRAPFRDYSQMIRAPDGAFLAWDGYPTFRVWRAEESGGAFRKVYQASGAELNGTGLRRQGDVVYAGAAISDDGGLTWTTIHSWR